ncbi:MAG: DUF2155 domain-containing protein [Deferrisomatales bacterium]|nr:DUF2155 domain-containing protein [Deferrisomatales bacterium]
MKMLWLPAIALAAALALGACSKKEEPAPAAAPAAPTAMPPSHPPMDAQPGAMGLAGPREVVVPEEVKNAWKAVVLSVADLETNTTKELTIDIGEAVTEGSLEITVESFLPAFSMTGGVITSASNETVNPAARLVVKEDGAELFAGWLFSLYPDAHPFEHDRYELVLKDFVAR